MPLSPERVFLDAGAAKVLPVLTLHGFEYVPGDAGVSSGGSFATSSFRRGAFEIGLIVRHRAALGCPNYSVGEGFAGHHDLIAALGAAGTERLISGPWPSFVDRDGTDAFEALSADLEQVILPALTRSEASFRLALANAVHEHQGRLGFGPRASRGHSA
jgi:hypothetical protein